MTLKSWLSKYVYFYCAARHQLLVNPTLCDMIEKSFSLSLQRPVLRIMLCRIQICFMLSIFLSITCRKSKPIDPNETHIQLAERISTYVKAKDKSHLDEILAISVAEISDYSIVREAEEAYLKLFESAEVHARLEALKLNHDNRIYFMLKDERSLLKFISSCNASDALNPLEKSICFQNVKNLWPQSKAAWVKLPTVIKTSEEPIKIEKYTIVLKGRGTPGDLIILNDRPVNANNLQLSEVNIREEFLYQSGYISEAMAYECCMATENSLESCEGGGENVLWEYGANSPDFKGPGQPKKNTKDFTCNNSKAALYRKVQNRH